MRPNDWFGLKSYSIVVSFSLKKTIFASRSKRSLRQCRIKKGKETRSFPSRNPFILYSFLFYWLSERYKFLESFSGVVCCNKHLCLFLTLTQWRSSQKRGIATLGKLHQLADKDLLLRRQRYVMQNLILFRAVDTDVLGCTEVANLRIKSSHK